MNVKYLIEELKMCVDLEDLADTLEWLSLMSTTVETVKINDTYEFNFYKVAGKKLERHYIFNLDGLSLMQMWDNGNDVIHWYRDGKFVE